MKIYFYDNLSKVVFLFILCKKINFQRKKKFQKKKKKSENLFLSRVKLRIINLIGCRKKHGVVDGFNVINLVTCVPCLFRAYFYVNFHSMVYTPY